MTQLALNNSATKYAMELNIYWQIAIVLALGLGIT